MGRGRITIHDIARELNITASTVSRALNGHKTIHLKVAGEKQGTVHLFIKEGHFDLTKSNRDEEINESMPWKLINPREDLSVLVLYTKDMNPANVDRLIQTMFYT